MYSISNWLEDPRNTIRRQVHIFDHLLFVPYSSLILERPRSAAVEYNDSTLLSLLKDPPWVRDE
jgi:hypothetical protein